MTGTTPNSVNTSATVFVELQAQAQQLLIDMQNFNQIVNGDANTTVALPSGVVVPSVQKVLAEIQAGFNVLQGKFNTLILGGQQALVNVLEKTATFDTVVQNPNIDQIISINNLLLIYAITINGLEQSDNDYLVVGNTITLPVANGFNIGDKIEVTYIPSA